MPRKKVISKKTADYRHTNSKRTNNPPAKLAAEGSIPKIPKKAYRYSPHLEPVMRFDPEGRSDRVREIIEKALAKQSLTPLEQDLLRGVGEHWEQPWLEWAGKQEEHTRGLFSVDPVALHIHERISAQAILSTAKRTDVQRDLFADPQLHYREAVRFYQHEMEWANRIVLGDSLQVMSSLAHRENLLGKVQMIYIDPPYGIKFASNFQPEVGKRIDHAASGDKDLIREPEMVKAYRDTWALGKSSYLSYMRDRLIVSRDLLKPSGSIFVQINDENCHLLRMLMDDVFGAENFISQISFQTTSGFATKTLATLGDYLLWYAKDIASVKVNKLYEQQPVVPGEGNARWIQLEDRTYRGVSKPEQRGDVQVPRGAVFYSPDNLQSQGAASSPQPYEHEGKEYSPLSSSHWKANYPDGMRRLSGSNRIHVASNSIRYRRLATDFPYKERGNIWTDTITGSFTEKKQYVVQTNTKVIERCLNLATDPGDLVVDPTCGSGTTALMSEKWGRRWITIDTSRVSVSIARQRLLTAMYEDFQTNNAGTGMAHDPGTGLVYKQAPKIELGSIARNTNLDPILEEYDSRLNDVLQECNVALKEVDSRLRRKLLEKLKKKQETEGKRAITDTDRKAWMLPAKGGVWSHWDLPFEPDPDWVPGLIESVEKYAALWREKMEKVDECIAANSDQVAIVDEPEVNANVVRVSGPFTVEGVMPEELALGGEDQDQPTSCGEGKSPSHPDADIADSRNIQAYLDSMLQHLKRDGVTFPDNKNPKFARLEPLYNSGSLSGMHAEGLWTGTEGDAATIGVGFGPQYGPITAMQVEELIREASRRGYNELIVAGFSFDAEAVATIEEAAHPRLTIHRAHIRPDINPGMDGLLKDTANSQLFSVFGSPSISVDEGDEGIIVTLEGVDVYDPVKNVVQSTGAAKVAAWFLDGDYNGRCFCTSQAFFPNQKAWDKLAKALRGSVDAQAFSAFGGTSSIPFSRGEHNCIAVKVIDARGNEVMTIHRLEVE